MVSATKPAIASSSSRDEIGGDRSGIDTKRTVSPRLKAKNALAKRDMDALSLRANQRVKRKSVALPVRSGGPHPMIRKSVKTLLLMFVAAVCALGSGRRADAGWQVLARSC